MKELHDRGFNIQLSLIPSACLISTVRRFVEEGLEKVISDRDLVCRISMVAHELLENASRHSSSRWASLHLRADRQGATGEGCAEITLCNEGTPEDLAHLREIADEIASASDPMVTYQQMMRRTSRRREGSGLGLIRIRAEGDMNLSVVVEGRQARTTATVDYRADADR